MGIGSIEKLRQLNQICDMRLLDPGFGQDHTGPLPKDGIITPGVDEAGSTRHFQTMIRRYVLHVLRMDGPLE